MSSQNQEFDDDSILKVKGPHYGKKLADVPADYLLNLWNYDWIHRYKKWERLKGYLAEYWDALEKEVQEGQQKE